MDALQKTIEEMFDNLPRREVILDALPFYRQEKDYTDPAIQGSEARCRGFPGVDQQAECPNSTRLVRALTYARNQQNYMMTYLEDAHCSISNNLSENSIHPSIVRLRLNRREASHFLR